MNITRLNRNLWLASSLGLLIVLAVAGPHFHAQEWLGRPLRRELGFDLWSPWYKVGGSRIEVIELRVVPGGTFSRAGVQTGDIPIEYMRPGPGFSGFYRALEQARGGAFTFRVVTGGDGSSLAGRASRDILVEVPARAEK